MSDDKKKPAFVPPDKNKREDKISSEKIVPQVTVNAGKNVGASASAGGGQANAFAGIYPCPTISDAGIQTIINLLTSPTFGLKEIKSEVQTIINILESPTFGLEEIKTRLLI